MKVLLVDNGTTLLNKLESLIPQNEIVRKFDEFNEQEARAFDMVILSGSSLHPVAGNEGKFSEEIEFIKNTTKPLIGICFGCELIVHALGGEIKKLETREKGIKEIKILDTNFYNKSVIKVYENHEWGISMLPHNFSVLAESDIGPEIIKNNTVPTYGLQFHPENLVDESGGDELFSSLFLKLSSQKFV